RRAALAVSLPGSAPARDAPQSASAFEGGDGDAGVHGGARLPRDRDADALQVHAGRRAGIYCAEPGASGPVLCPAPIAPAVQADPDGGGGGALLPAGALLSG